MNELAFEDGRGEFGQLQGVGAAHAAAHVGLLHLDEFVSGLLHELARSLLGAESALEVAGIVIGKSLGSDSVFEFEAALLDEGVDEGGEVDDFFGESAGRGQSVGVTGAFEIGDEVVLETDGAGGAG